MKSNASLLRVLTPILTLALALSALQGAQVVRAEEELPPDASVSSPLREPSVDPATIVAQLQASEVGVQSIIGSDSRIRVSNTTDEPWRHIVQLVMGFDVPGGTVYIICSGFFIDPTTVITAGHCVYDRDNGYGWADEAIVTAAQDGATIPYPDVNPALGNLVYSTAGWVYSGNPTTDYGAVKMADGGDLGNTVGWFDYAYFSDSYLSTYLVQPATVAGYPGDKILGIPDGCPDEDSNGIPDYVCGTMWYDSAPLIEIAPFILSYEIDTYGGQSGSPLWVMDGSDLYVIGVHAYGVGAPCHNSTAHPETNCAVRITPEVAQNFADWSNSAPITNCKPLTLTHTGAGANPVASFPRSAGCGSNEYIPGAAIPLTAAPAPGYQVGSWSGTQNDSSTSLNNLVVMPDGPHTAAVNYTPTGILMTPGVYDDTSPKITYTGSWTPYVATGPYNGTLRYSSVIGQQATFVIEGNRFSLTYTANSNRGVAEIYVDGVLYATVNQYNATLAWQRTWTSGLLTDVGPHTVRIVHKSGSIVDIDAVTVTYVPPPAPLNPGAYEDTDTNIIYSAGWLPYTGSGPTNNTLQYSTVLGSEAVFQINGNRFRLTYTANSSRGTAEIYVDGALYATVNQYNATLVWQRTWTSGVLPGPTPHTIRIVHKTGSMIDLDAITVMDVPPPAPLNPGTYEDTDTNLTYSAGWLPYTGNGPTANTLQYSNVIGSEATFQINGNRFTLTYTANSNRGVAEIYVDGALYATLNQYNATLAWQRTWTSGILSGATPHTIRIVHKSGTIVDLDAVTVMNVPPPSPLNPGTYEDTNTNIVYTSGWLPYTGSGPTANTLYYSTVIGGEATFQINGNRFTLTYTANSSRGVAEIYVDGALYATVNQYSATLAWQRTWTSGILTGATPHTIRIVHKTGTYIDLDAITVINVLPPSPLNPGTYEDTDTNITYSAGWLPYTGSGPTNNTLQYSTTIGSEASFQINGNRFTLTYTANTNRGVAEIYVDGALYATVNQYNSSLVWQRTWTSGILTGATPHTVQIVHKSGTVVDLDAITVMNVPPPAPLDPGTYENTNTNIIYNGPWDIYTGSGPTANTLHYSTVVGSEATFQINGNRFSLTYTANTNRGVAEIYVDGSLYATINQYNSTLAWQRIWTSGLLPGATPHTIRVVHKTGTVVDLDAITVMSVPPPTPLNPGTYEDNNTNILYTAGWLPYTGSGPTNNTLQYSTVVGSDATFQINSNRFTLTYTGFTNRGVAEIYVDGVLYASLNQYNATLAWQRTWTSGILPGATPHTIRIVHKSGTYIDIDAITVHTP